jgi:hypothetical protein
LIAGLTILSIAARYSFGLVLLAPLGMWITDRIMRARNLGLTRWSSWLGASIGVLVGFAALAVFGLSRVPASTWRTARAAADSAAAVQAKRPPPAWLARIAPAAAGQAAATNRPTPGLSFAMAIWGSVLVLGMISAFVGTIGWVGAMLLVFCASGRWLSRPPVPLPVDVT